MLIRNIDKEMEAYSKKEKQRKLYMWVNTISPALTSTTAYTVGTTELKAGLKRLAQAFLDIISHLEDCRKKPRYDESKSTPEQVRLASEQMDSMLKTVLDENSLTKKQLYPALREALTLGEKKSPPVEGILAVMKLDMAIKRLQYCVILLGTTKDNK